MQANLDTSYWLFYGVAIRTKVIAINRARVEKRTTNKYKKKVSQLKKPKKCKKKQVVYDDIFGTIKSTSKNNNETLETILVQYKPKDALQLIYHTACPIFQTKGLKPSIYSLLKTVSC